MMTNNKATNSTNPMMMNTTIEQLRGLRLAGMASGLEEQLTQVAMTAISFEERLALLVDRELAVRGDRKRPALRTWTPAPGVDWSARQ